MRKKITYITSVILSLFVGATAMFLIIKYSPNDGNGSKTIFRDTSNIKISESDTISSSIDKIYDAVVVVESYNNNQLIGSGTGFVYKKDDKYGYIMTNNHVVSSGNTANVLFTNEEVAEATILGRDEYADLAVLKVDLKYITNVAQIGKSADVKVGDTVFAIGAPVGREYIGTVTKGIISGKDRMVSVTLNDSGADYIMNVMQTDASINPGNSGGPLVNINGEVVGINSLKLVQEEIEGIGFSIPIDDAMTFVEKLEKGETIVRPMMGVSLIDQSETYALYQYRIMLKEDSPNGVVVAEISNDSPASKGGLKAGDIITKINDIKIKSRAQFRYELYKHSIGDEIKVTYYRDSKEQTVNVKLDIPLK